MAYLDRWVRAGDIKTRFLTAGNGEAVIFLHGGGAGASGQHNWQGNINEMADAGLSAYAPDIVGFGLSDKPSGWHTFEKKVEHIRDFMDALCIEKASFVGNSMGAGISCGMAALHPERVNKVILLGGGAVRVGAPTKDFKNVIDYEPSLEKMTAVLKGFCYNPDLVTEEMILDRYEMSQLPGAAESYRDFMSNILNIDGYLEPVQAGLKKSDAPFMLIWGRDDKIVPLKLGDQMKELLPDARYEIYDKCGHWAQIECRDQFNSDLVNFLNEG